MYEYIKGPLYRLKDSAVVIECSGIGFHIKIPTSSFINNPISNGEEVKLFVSHVVNDNGCFLYGFCTSIDRDCFNMLLAVSGIGPKAALSILSYLSISELSRAVLADDCNKIAEVQGIGKKTASKLVIELKDKLPALVLPDSPHVSTFSMKSKSVEDAIYALISLGYTKSSAEKLIMDVSSSISIESDASTILQTALRRN